VSTEADNLSQSAESDVRLGELDRVDMARLVSGHEAALNALMERHAGKLFNHLIRCLQNEEDAADAAQEAFMRVFQHRAKFDARQRFSTWLYAIATNLVKDRYRYRTRHPQISLDAENEATGRDFRESLPEQRPSQGEVLQSEERTEIVRQFLKANRDPRTVITDEQSHYFGIPLKHGSLVPDGTPSRLGATHFEAWLRRSTPNP
jgi:RNA polymerase sigma-70 factor (ECF subfamily)